MRSINNKILFTISLIILISIFSILLKINNYNNKNIPKKIWTYWNDKKNIPELVLKCIDTWKDENLDYSIEILDINRIKELVDIDLRDMNIDENFFARHSDIARLLIIAKYGGIWLDATIICTKSLKWINEIHKRENVEFIGYIAPHTTNQKTPIIENWFLAAIPRSKFVMDWLKESIKMINFNDEMSYIESIRKSGIDFQNLNPYLPYLTIHLCVTVILQRNEGVYKLFLMDPRYDYGPFKYLDKNGWDTEKSLNALCIDEDLQTPLIKLRGMERRFINENMDKIKCNECKNRNILNVLHPDTLVRFASLT